MAPFSQDTFRFLRQLEKNNNREWFQAHAQEFEDRLRTPALEFIEDAAAWLEAAGYPFRGEAKKSGGALGRIHRDTRFSADKTPYHTHLIMHFAHKDSNREKPGPVIGIRLDAHGETGIGGGIYGGETATLNKVRDAIVAAPDEWHKATKGLQLWGDSLKTAPKGYDKQHPLIDDIKRKAWMVSMPLTEQQFTSDVMTPFQQATKRMAPLTDFLARALL